MKQVMVVLIVLAAGVAWAGTPEEDYGNKVAPYDSQLRRWKDEGMRAARKDLTEESCKAVVAEARKAGVKKLTSFNWEITVDAADTLCADYGKAWRLADAIDLFTDLALAKSNLTPSMGPSETYVKRVVAMVADCSKRADALLAEGQPADLELNLNNSGSMKLGDIKVQLCDAAAKAASVFTKQMEEAEKKANERLVKAGLGGDKLDLYKENDGDNGGIYLAGFTSVEGNPKAYAKASTWFIWLTSEPDAEYNVIHTIRKYTFSGNKLTKTTEKTVKTPFGEKPSKNAFR